MWSSALALSVVLNGLQVLAVDPLVALNYTSYQGTALSGGITQWLGMRFAAPPVGDLRFAAPVNPVANATVQMADQVRIVLPGEYRRAYTDWNQHGLICLATGANPNSTTTSEDCLFGMLQYWHNGILFVQTDRIIS